MGTQQAPEPINFKQHAKQLGKNYGSSESEKSQQEKPKLVDDPEIFLQLTDFWEALFKKYDSKSVTNKYGTCTPDNPEVEYWAELLITLSPEEVKAGLDGIDKLNTTFIVKRNDFRQLATKNRRTSPAHKPYKEDREALPKTTRAERNAAAQIAMATSRKLIAAGNGAA